MVTSESFQTRSLCSVVDLYFNWTKVPFLPISLLTVSYDDKERTLFLEIPCIFIKKV